MPRCRLTLSSWGALLLVLSLLGLGLFTAPSTVVEAQLATSTASPTAPASSATPTLTATTAAATATPAETATPAATVTPSATGTVAATDTPTATPAATSTGTIVATATPTSTPTLTPVGVLPGADGRRAVHQWPTAAGRRAVAPDQERLRRPQPGAALPVGELARRAAAGWQPGHPVHPDHRELRRRSDCLRGSWRRRHGGLPGHDHGRSLDGRCRRRLLPRRERQPGLRSVRSVRAGVPPAVQPDRATPAARAAPAAARRLVPATSPAGTAWARAGDADPAAGSGSDRADPAQRAARALLPGD